MKSCNPGNLIDKLLANNRPRFTPDFFQREGKSRWEESFRSTLRDCLGIPPLSRNIEAVETQERQDGGNYLREDLLIRGVDDFPLTLLTPEEGKDTGITILALNGHGPGVSAMTGDYRPEECHHYFGKTLAEAGFTVVLPEIAGFGSYRLEEDRDKPDASSCQTLAMKLLPLGYTLTGLRLWQLLTVLDYTAERFGTERLGCFGFSGGGLLGYMLTALDGRIGALGLTGYCSIFGESIYEHTHCADNYIPGLFKVCDQPEIAHLIAPRPLYVEAGREDRVFPAKGARMGMERIGACYDLAGCRERFETFLPEGGHEIQGRDMIRWYKEVL